MRLLKHIVRCYLRLSDNPRAREALRQCLPDLLRSPQFTACLKDDPTTCRCCSCAWLLPPKGMRMRQVQQTEPSLCCASCRVGMVLCMAMFTMACRLHTTQGRVTAMQVAGAAAH